MNSNATSYGTAFLGHAEIICRICYQVNLVISGHSAITSVFVRRTFRKIYTAISDRDSLKATCTRLLRVTTAKGMLSTNRSYHLDPALRSSTAQASATAICFDGYWICAPESAALIVLPSPLFNPSQNTPHSTSSIVLRWRITESRTFSLNRFLTSLTPTPV